MITKSISIILSLFLMVFFILGTLITKGVIHSYLFAILAIIIGANCIQHNKLNTK